MPWWAIAYLMIFAVWSWITVENDYYQNKQPVWSILLTALSTLAVAYLFLAYWYPALIPNFRFVAPVAFMASTGWQVVQEIRGLRRIYHHPDLTNTEFYIIVIIPVIFLFPAYLIAGFTAFRP